LGFRHGAIITDGYLEGYFARLRLDDDYKRLLYNSQVMQPAPSTGPGRPDPTARQRILTALKIGITLLGLFLAVRNLDVQTILSVISGVDLKWLTAGAGLIALSLIVRAFRWHIILHGVGSSIRFGRLVELYLIGSFFNAFLPSGLGGDVIRAAEAAQDVEPSIAASTVLVDRMTGLLALFAMALAVLPFRPAGFPDELALTIGAICVVGLAAGLALIDGRPLRALIRRLPPSLRAQGNGFLEKFALAIHRCGWRALGAALLVSVLFNLIQIGWWAAAGQALGLHITFSYLLLIVPVMALALLVPSIGGLGVRENLSPALFIGAAITAEQAVALTLLVFALERVASLLGAPLYLASLFREKRSAAKPSDEIINPR
jgi:uncharacterized membrane protein YbhN (UPF0104 family)